MKAIYILFSTLVLIGTCPTLIFAEDKSHKTKTDHLAALKDRNSEGESAIFASPVLGVGVNPANLFGGIAGFEFSKNLSFGIGLSNAGARSKALGNATIISGRINESNYKKNRLFALLSLWRYGGVGPQKVSFDKKIKEYRPGGGSCDPAECESYNTKEGLRAKWSYSYATLGGGYEFNLLESGDFPLKLSIGGGFSYCFAESLSVNDEYDSKLGNPTGIEIDPGSLGGSQAIVKRGDFGPYVEVGLSLYFPVKAI